MLLSLWFLVLLVTLTGAASVAAVALDARRRRRRRAGGMGRARVVAGRVLSAILVLALAATAFADQQNRQFQYIPSFAALFGHISPNFRPGGLQAVRALQQQRVGAPSASTTPGTRAGAGTVVKVDIPGATSGVAARPAYVYLPGAYFDPAQASRRFPVLYLLHGSPGVAADWVRGGRLDQAMDHLIAGGSVQPFIVVMPDTNGGYQQDLECQNLPGGVQDETYLARDVVGYVDGHLRTNPARASRAIGGLSTGGYCAVNLAFHHQDMFSAVVSHSGSGRPDRGIYTGDLFGHDATRRRANTPVDYLPTLALQAPVKVYLDSGRTDHWATRETRLLQRALRQRGVPTTFRTSIGGHSFGTWKQDLYHSLPWVSQQFNPGTAAPHRARALPGHTIRAVAGPAAATAFTRA